MMTTTGENWYGKLKNTWHLELRTLKHIFEGELNGGIASGYHYEGIPNRAFGFTRKAPIAR
jgi:hypothetical protein